RDVIDLSEEVAAVIVKLREQEPARQVNVLIEPGMKARGDVKLLQVALVHLIGNAWKFTSTRANGEISIGSGTTPNGARMWWIHDNGVGFDMAYSSKLFQPFNRLHDSGAFDGLGVGLASAHAAITRHGGSIWADARPDGGAKLYFTLGQEIDSATGN
ncbi:MAG: ATP-binding protein, partial [Polaromonas sp.]|nr:ATP-binding protein [Polaromonas sp.]